MIIKLSYEGGCPDILFRLLQISENEMVSRFEYFPSKIISQMGMIFCALISSQEAEVGVKARFGRGTGRCKA